MRGIRKFGPGRKPHEGILGGMIERRVIHDQRRKKKKKKKRGKKGK